MGRSVPKATSSIQAGIVNGLQIGAQLCVQTNQRQLINLAIGESSPGVAMTADTLMIWLSSTKPITAVCIAQLWERRLLNLDDAITKYIPEFAGGGKETITIRQMLIHTAGIRAAANNFSRDSWETTLNKIYQSSVEPGWIPGKKAGYHVASTWFVLGELVRRIDGRRFEKYVREEIFLPLKMVDSWVGLPPDKYAEYGDRIGIMQNTDPAFRPPHAWDTPEMAALCKPGGNGRGPMRDLVRFYEMLLYGGSLDGVKIISPQTVEAMTARHRVGMYDQSFKHIMDWGLGFIVNNNQYGVDTIRYGYGPRASWRTFGHSGHRSSVAFADPKHNLAVALVFNGTPSDAMHDQRVRSVLTAIYEDLEIKED
jgi:CubicO group peptidase (beta-lactamase class C family)